jgi:hypothetical protein
MLNLEPQDIREHQRIGCWQRSDTGFFYAVSVFCESWRSSAVAVTRSRTESSLTTALPPCLGLFSFHKKEGIFPLS